MWREVPSGPSLGKPLTCDGCAISRAPAIGYMNGINTTLTGKMPAGYVSVWNFDGNKNTKNSATTKPGNAGGKDIF